MLIGSKPSASSDPDTNSDKFTFYFIFFNQRWKRDMVAFVRNIKGLSSAWSSHRENAGSRTQYFKNLTAEAF